MPTTARESLSARHGALRRYSQGASAGWERVCGQSPVEWIEIVTEQHWSIVSQMVASPSAWRKKLRAKEFSIPIFEWFRYAEI
jgi:hypothetical protein